MKNYIESPVVYALLKATVDAAILGTGAERDFYTACGVQLVDENGQHRPIIDIYNELGQLHRGQR